MRDNGILIDENLVSFIKSYGQADLMRTLEIVAPASEEVFIKRLYEEIDVIVTNIEKTPKEHKDDNEDRLSVEIVNCLNVAGYVAQKDPTQGGHVDIFVTPKQSRKYSWYGEAKIWGGVAYLSKGMSQLLDRYATGREKNLGFLVYFKESDLVNKMKKWREHLEGLPSVDATSSEIIDSSSFTTLHAHKSGHFVRVRHFSLNIDWNPA